MSTEDKVKRYTNEVANFVKKWDDHLQGSFQAMLKEYRSILDPDETEGTSIDDSELKAFSFALTAIVMMNFMLANKLGLEHLNSLWAATQEFGDAVHGQVPGPTDN